MYLEQNLSVDDMVNRGYEKDVLVTILNMIDRAEYKRRQMPQWSGLPVILLI